MRTLFLTAPSSRNGQTKFQSDRDGKMNGSSLVGTMLADRFKILKTINVDSFKAHDVVLDQAVTVRQALGSSQRDDDTWRQKVQKLALVRHPNFLNVLDVVSDKSNYFVITEPRQGNSIADLLKERSRFDVEDVLALMTPLAGALDLAASFACCANSISARWLFAEKRRSFVVDAEQRRLSEWASSFAKIDVWELVRPRIGIKRPLKPQSRASRKLAIEQAALLTYELLGGQKEHRKPELKRWFQPINGLGDAGNAVLYRGLEGSPVFESSGDFFQKFESAIQSASLESRVLLGPALPGLALSTQENSGSLPGSSAVLKGFDRDTRCLAAGVFGVLILATSVLGILISGHHPSAVEPTAAVQPSGNLLPIANNTTLFKDVGVRGKSSASEITPGQAKSGDQAFSETSQKENRTTQTEADASTPTLVQAFAPEINHINAKVAASLRSLAHWQDHARSIGLKITHARSSGSIRRKFSDVEMRLLALWHQSLVRSERSRTWAPFSNLNKKEGKRVGYTVQISQ